MVALLSDIEVWVFVTDIPVAPTTAFTSSGLSSNSARSRSTRGRGIIARVGVVDSALPLVTAHPVVRTQITAMATAAVGWRMCSSHSSAGEDMVQQCSRRRCEVERCFLITIIGVLDND